MNGATNAKSSFFTVKMSIDCTDRPTARAASQARADPQSVAAEEHPCGKDGRGWLRYLDRNGVGDERARLHRVHQRLLERQLFDAAKIEAVDSVPDYGGSAPRGSSKGQGVSVRVQTPASALSVRPRTVDLFGAVVAILNRGNVDGGFVRKDHAAGRLGAARRRGVVVVVVAGPVGGSLTGLETERGVCTRGRAYQPLVACDEHCVQHGFV